MSERNHTYLDVLSAAADRFRDAAGATHSTASDAGGRFVSLKVLDSCLAEAVRETVEGLPDVAMLAVVSNRPHLLHAHPGLYGEMPTPRGALERAVMKEARRDLADVKSSLVAGGQDEDTLPRVAGEALAALAQIEASGRRFRGASDVRDAFGSGDWEDDMIQGCGWPLVLFLRENGHEGIGNDLEAVMDARETVMESVGTPGPRQGP